MEYNLKFHLDRYNNNILLQKLLKNLVEYIESNLESNTQYNSTYIRFDFPSGKKWAWIDTLESGKAIRFRFHEIDEDDQENFHELSGYSSNK